MLTATTTTQCDEEEGARGITKFLVKIFVLVFRCGNILIVFLFRPDHLNGHIKQVHTTERPHKCQVTIYTVCVYACVCVYIYIY